MKPGNVPLKSIRLLDQVRERIRYLHYSLSTEKVYLCRNRPGADKWVNRFHACFNNFAPAAFDALASKVQNGNA